MVKAPKLHFLDSGLLCYLLNIREPEQLRHHPLRGSIFESWVVSELYKAQVHRGEQPNLYHYRESRGLKMDVLVDLGDRLCAIEVKSAATIATDFFKCFDPFAGRISNTNLPSQIENIVIYGGETSQLRSKARIIAWKDVGEILQSKKEG
ncbi:MAG: DUF4143 domain-containing protein [Proteobacteria bacterium]|nr:DUF4143 domain-containing protein [Desulfobulbaceae bacterium]MBU4152422.1 DUF4143 domain-containing protein [Pseudomonadota bacterium]